ncbi:MAG TPA: hypothetical protein VEY12_11095 [Thermoplasmata archaeon]|nr:hypothetical protein [Thermoplasmata archaeon]
MRSRYVTHSKPRVQGFDTEADINGNLIVACSPRKKFTFQWARWRANPRRECLRLLLFLWDEGCDFNFCYNLKYDLAVLLKPLAFRFLRAMKKDKRCHTVSFGPYRVTLRGTSFVLRRDGNNHPKRFFDVANFFSDGDQPLRLEEAAETFLNEHKTSTDLGEILGGLGGREYFRAHRAEVVAYCKQDALLAKRLAQVLRDFCPEIFGRELWPTRYNSKASISKAAVEIFSPELAATKPWMDRKRGFNSLARKAFKGGIFWTPILGRVTDVIEEDITNAYPDTLRRLPDISLLRRRCSNSYHPEALLGAYLILVDYDGLLPLSPELRGKKRGSAHILYPTSRGLKRPYYASKAEVEYFLETRRITPEDVLLAEEYFGPYEPQFSWLDPFLVKINALKERLKDNPDDREAKVKRQLFKIVVNALYGCLAESRHGETSITTWPYAAEVTARTRVKIWRKVKDIEACGGFVVSINTDSVRYVLPPKIRGPIPQSFKHGVGEFERKLLGRTVTHYQSGIAIIESPGVCVQEICLDGPNVLCTSKDCHDVVVRCRGKPYLRNHPDVLRNAVGPTVSVPSRHVTTFLEGLQRGKLEEIGRFDDPSSDEDDTLIDLRSNLRAFGYPEDALTFETLNARMVRGTPHIFDEVAGPDSQHVRLS